MLGQMIGDRPHAFGDRLVLLMDPDDATEIAAALLRLAIDQPIIARISLEPPPAVPVAGVRQVIEHPLEAGHHLAALVRADGRRMTPPYQADEHRMRVVHWDPRAV